MSSPGPIATKVIKKRRQYTNKDLQNAIQSVSNGMKVCDACRQYGIPRSTLDFKFNTNTVGRLPSLPSLHRAVSAHICFHF